MPVVDQGLQRPLVHHHRQSAGGVAQGNGLARSQHHRAALGSDDAFVANLQSQQGDEPGFARAERTAVGHHALTLGEVHPSGQKVGVGDLHGPGHQRAHIHLGIGAEQHPVGIEQEHLPVGHQLAVDLRGRARLHPVQGHRIGARLLELHRSLLTDVKALPVDDGLAGLLLNRELVDGLLNLHLAGGHLSALWQGIDGRWSQLGRWEGRN